MVAPFCGCIFGAFLYDLFIYTGPDSPVNTPWMGFKNFVNGGVVRRDEKPTEVDGSERV